MDNQGEAVRAIQLEPAGIQFEPSDGELREGASTASLWYRFEPDKGGSTIRFTINFETVDGWQQRQTYETRHGFCELRRIDP
jgi:hypothetical protein